MMRSRLIALGGVFLAALFTAPSWGAATPPQPGTINYIEGQASAGGQALTEKSVGSAELAAGESLTTLSGRAEVLLTPGIFLRTDDNSTVQMVNPGLADTVAALKRGRALVEVNEIRKENNVRINLGNASARLLKAGLYDFDMDRGLIRVFDGKALVQLNDKQLSLHSGHEVNLNAANKQLKETKFDKKASEDDFYRWASLRSSYLAEANVDAARRYVVGGGGPGWYGTGWYWDPWFDAYTFLPADGFFFNSFGWGFYSPFYVYGAPYFGYGGYSHGFGPGYHPPFVAGTRGFGGPVRGFGRGSTGGFRVSPGPSFHGGGGFRGRR